MLHLFIIKCIDLDDNEKSNTSVPLDNTPLRNVILSAVSVTTSLSSFFSQSDLAAS